MANEPAKPKSFRDPVEPETRAERLLADCVLSGKVADASNFEVDTDKEVRAAFLRDLCLNAEIRNIDPRGILLGGAKITGTFSLEGASLDRPLVLIDCTFTKQLVFRDAKVKLLVLGACTLPGIAADRLSVTGRLSFQETKVTGETRLSGAKVIGELNCDRATFINNDGNAFSADGLEVGGGLFFLTTQVMGETRLLGAKVIGPVECSKATFTNPRGVAFNADGLNVGGDLVFRETTLVGETRLPGAKVVGDVDCTEAKFINEGRRAFSADGLEVGNRLYFRNLNGRVVGGMSLNHASVKTLFADSSGWPDAGFLNLDGFRYETLGVYQPWTIVLGWIERQFPGEFAPQPFEQAIKVYRDAGHLSDAREMGIAKEESISNTGNWRLTRRVWRRFFGLTLSYGYKPWRALIILYFISVCIFASAFDAGYMLPSKERVFLHSCFVDESPHVSCPGWERPSRWWTLSAPIRLPTTYPAFNPLAYSLDTLIPLFDLHQEDYWLPSGGSATGGFLKFWLWFQIVSGWVLTTLTVGSLTGIIKKIE